MFRKVFEGVVDYQEEDGGQADICDEVPPSPDGTMFVRVQAWEDEGKDQNQPPHVVARSIEGKRIRVTIEEIGEPGDEKSV